ncbi:hypothetical protein K439DRAFT_1615184 [Ramaria rubella]|nr:hypothetical protein K439DRAFT_1615184 [Ramaria rubella]
MISNDGPDLTSQPSQLWASCLAMQEQTSLVLIPLDPLTHLLSEVVEGVKRLFISQGDPSIHVLGNHTESQLCQAPSGARTAVPLEQANHHRISKRECSRHTLKILENFHAIKLCIPLYWAKLSGSPSYIVLGNVQSKLKGLCIAVKKVTRCMPTIDQGRMEIVQELERLEAQVTKLNVVIPHASEEPVRVDCDCLDEIAQLSMFLGVVCMVVMGISWQAGDLIMGLVCLLLQMAWKGKDGNVDLLNMNTLVQIPSTIMTALSKFNLDGHVTIYAMCLTCHCMYKPQYKDGSRTATYPRECMN